MHNIPTSALHPLTYRVINTLEVVFHLNSDVLCEGLIYIGLGMIMTILYSDCYNYRFRVIFGRCIFVASSDFMFYIWTSHSDCLISFDKFCDHIFTHY